MYEPCQLEKTCRSISLFLIFKLLVLLREHIVMFGIMHMSCMVWDSNIMLCSLTISQDFVRLILLN